MPLKGKIVLVTGGAGELGRVVAGRFLKEGATVFITSRGPLAAGTFPPTLRRKVRVVRADVTRRTGVSNLFRTISGKSKRVDILVNTVGGFVSSGPVSETDPKVWERMMTVNLTSVFLCCREYLRQKGLSGYGRIFNIAAQTVFRPSRDRAAYAVSKGAVATLTALLGEELRGSGLTANAFAPSILDTPTNRKSMPDADFTSWVDPALIADEIVHLCEPAASAVNGAIIPIFGGV